MERPSRAPLPPILNEALMSRAVETYHIADSGAPLEIKSCEFRLSSANGENYSSDVYVANVTYELAGSHMQRSFIVKLMLPEVAEIGSNEQAMFKVVLPGMERSLRAGNGVDTTDCKLHARCLVGQQGDQEYYVLENLNTLGYFCTDRLAGLDANYARTLLRKLGIFHAASMMYAKEFPEVIGSLRKSHFEHGATDYIAEAITFGGLEYVANMIESWPGYEHLAPKVRNVAPKFNELVKMVVDPHNATFKVLNHGDLWINNLLFKVDTSTQRPTDVLFVDFQQCFWGGCGFDLNWFFHTSLDLRVLREERHCLLECYHGALSATLETGGFPAQEIPKIEQVVADFKRNEIIGLYASLCELPIVALDRSVSKDFTTDCYASSEKMAELRKFMYANKRVKDTLLYTLRYFEEAGVLS